MSLFSHFPQQALIFKTPSTSFRSCHVFSATIQRHPEMFANLCEGKVEIWCEFITCAHPFLQTSPMTWSHRFYIKHLSWWCLLLSGDTLLKNDTCVTWAAMKKKNPSISSLPVRCDPFPVTVGLCLCNKTVVIHYSPSSSSVLDINKLTK